MQKIIIAGVLFLMMGLAVSVSHKQEIKRYVEANLLKTKISLTFDGKPIYVDVDTTVTMGDMTIKAVKALSQEQLGIQLGKTSSSVIANNTIYENTDTCKNHKEKAYLEIDLNNNRMFCGDKSIYTKYIGGSENNGGYSEAISSEEIPPLKLKLMLKSCNESLDKTQADNQDLQRKILTYSTDKDADKTKSIIAMQNDRLNAQRVEIEELQKQLVEFQRNQVVKQ